jgi:hypothetical protein
LSLPRQVAFAAAACQRIRPVFVLCRGATPVSVYDAALAEVWEAAKTEDWASADEVYELLTHSVESSCDDTLSREWLAWLALASFEYPCRLPAARRPIETLAQCSAFALTIMSELDLRLGWEGAPRAGPLASLEWAAQRRCAAILAADVGSKAIPLAELTAAGEPVSGAVMESAAALAAATGWDLQGQP